MKKQEIEIISDTEFKKSEYALSNEFIRMPNRLSVQALQTFGLILSKIDWKKDNGDYINVKLPLKEVLKVCNSKSNNYEFYINFIEELQNKAWIRIVNENEYKRANLIPYSEVKNNIVSVDINNRLNDYIQNLKSNYTVFKIANTAKFTSRFSYILYINLCSWNDHRIERKDALDERERYYTTKQLKEMFDLGELEYTHIENGKPKFDRTIFEKRVIEKAVREINEYTNIMLKWWKEKDGKKVSKYVFWWVRKDGYNDALGIPNL